MKKVLLTVELDKKYGSQLEYMGHTNLEIMLLNDGNYACVENDNFYIILKSLRRTKGIDPSLTIPERISWLVGSPR